MSIRAHLSENLRSLRAERGWSQEELAFEAQLHRTYISDLERSARNPSIEIIEKLAKAFCVKPGRLLDPPRRDG